MNPLRGRFGDVLEDSAAVALHGILGIVVLGILINSQAAMRLDQLPVVGKVTQSMRWVVNQVYDVSGES